MIKIFLIGSLLLFLGYIMPVPISISISQKEMEMSVERYRRAGIKFPEIVFTQSLLESNNYRSSIFKENNNPHGMKWNNRGYAKSVNRGHALYDNVDDAIEDYRVWQSTMMRAHKKIWNNNFVTEDDYFFFLQHLTMDKKGTIYRYAEDMKYIQKLKGIMQKFKNKEWQNGEIILRQQSLITRDPKKQEER